MIKDELGDRIKVNYENRAKTYLTRRLPVIVRIDGRAFHTLTKKFEKPFDTIFGVAMMQTAESLCKEISGAQLAYTQSDEISILLQDYATLQTDAWFDYQVQKLASVSAGLATMYFNKHFPKLVVTQAKLGMYSLKYLDKDLTPLTGSFDARCFSIPKEEVCNYFIWRQNDASKNSIQMLARAHFSHKELQGISQVGLQDKLILEKGINWNDLEIWKKRGSCIVRDENRKWVIDKAIPIFSQDRDYINRFVYLEDKKND